MQQFHTLCIADDDFEDRMLLIDAVKSLEADIEIIEAGDGFELLEILQSKKPSKQSLIILDMNMPKLNGLETLEKIRSFTKLAFIPAVMLSTSNNRELIESAKKLGAKRYFTKPNTFDDLKKIARQLFFPVSC